MLVFLFVIWILCAYLVLPVLSIEILQVSSQGFTAVQLYRKIDWGNVRVVFVLLYLLFHSRVDEV